MLTLSKTRLCAGGSYRFVNNLGVTFGFDGSLCNDGSGAYRTVLTLGKTCCGAGRSYRFVNYLCVIRNGNHGLRNEDLVAFFTPCSFGETCGGTGGCLSLERFGFFVSAFSIAPMTAYVTFVIILIIVGVRDDRQFLRSYDDLSAG